MSASHGGLGNVEPPSRRVLNEHRAIIEDLLIRHWARVDRIVDLPVADLFCENGQMHIGQLVKRGSREISEYYRSRRFQEDETGRKTRHIITNIIVDPLADSDIAFSFIASVYSGVGALPLLSGPPSTIADFSGHCRLSCAGEWLIAQITASVTFVGPGAPAFAKKDQAE